MFWSARKSMASGAEIKSETESSGIFEQRVILLPSGYQYHVSQLRVFSSEANRFRFSAEIRIPISSADGAKEWVSLFQALTRVTLRLRTTVPIKDGKQSQNLFKTYYRCHHNTMPRSSTADQRLSSKNTMCPALATVTVRRQCSKRSRSKNKDPLLADFPTLVQLEHTHNHSLDSADFLRHLDVSDATVDKFRELFSRGHSPASALKLHKMDLQLEHGADYLIQAADRSQCPDIFFCYRLYKQVFDPQPPTDPQPQQDSPCTKYSPPTQDFLPTQDSPPTQDFLPTQDSLPNQDSLPTQDSPPTQDSLPTQDSPLQIRDRCEQDLHEFQDTMHKIIERGKSNAELMQAIRHFTQMVGKMTPSALASALFSFGKSTGCASVVSRGLISVQPTAVTRRTTHVGGRWCLQSGRTPSEAYQTRRKRESGDSSQLLPKKKARKAPHCLSRLVANNENFGKSHTSKW